MSFEDSRRLVDTARAIRRLTGSDHAIAIAWSDDDARDVMVATSSPAAMSPSVANDHMRAMLVRILETLDIPDQNETIHTDSEAGSAT